MLLLAVQVQCVNLLQSFTAVTDSLSETTATEGIDQATTASSGVWHEVLDTNTNCIYYWNQQDNITSWVLPTNATVVKLQTSTTDTGKVIKGCYNHYVGMCVCIDQMNAVTTTAVANVTEDVTDYASEDLVEYGPQLPENYAPPNDDHNGSATMPDVSSRKRAAMDDDNNLQDIDNMLDDALEVKRARLDEGRLSNDLLCSVLQLEWLIMQLIVKSLLSKLMTISGHLMNSKASGDTQGNYY